MSRDYKATFCTEQDLGGTTTTDVPSEDVLQIGPGEDFNGNAIYRLLNENAKLGVRVISDGEAFTASEELTIKLQKSNDNSTWTTVESRTITTAAAVDERFIWPPGEMGSYIRLAFVSDASGLTTGFVTGWMTLGPPTTPSSLKD